MRTKEIQALIELLRDDDPKIRSAVGERFSSLGEDGLEALGQASASVDPRLRVRARNLLWQIRSAGVCSAFEELLKEPAFDLEQALVLMARTEEPDLEAREITDELARLAEALEPVQATCHDLETRAVELGRFLGQSMGFHGNSAQYDDPRNTYMNDVLRRRCGIPISLSAVYIVVGRRVGMSVRGVGMPMQFLVSVDEGGQRILLDPFGGGRVMTREACKALLAGFHHSFREDYLRPVSDRHMMRRMIANLVRAYHDRGDNVRLGRYYRFVNILQSR